MIDIGAVFSSEELALVTGAAEGAHPGDCGRNGAAASARAPLRQILC